MCPTPVDVALHDPERLAHLYAAASALTSATTLDDALKWLVRSARRLGNGDRATFTLVAPEPENGELVWSGYGGRRAAVVLEREIVVDDQPYGTLCVSTTRPQFAPEEEAAVELLCIHAAIAIEKILLVKQRELVRRVRTLVGDQERQTPGSVRHVGDVLIDTVRHLAFVAGTPIHLTPSEFRLLELLTEEPERVYTRDEIAARLWGTTDGGSSRAADVHVTRLRRKLQQDPLEPKRLEAVRGVGYKFVPVGGRPLDNPPIHAV